LLLDSWTQKSSEESSLYYLGITCNAPYTISNSVLLLFRFVKDSVLWACLAGLSVAAKQLDTAEVAYANIQVKK
jgi:hypothetical protein